MNIANTLLQQVATRPNETAIVELTKRGDRRITFAELDAAAAALAERLRQRGFEPGRRILVMMDVSIDLYIALTAVFRAGLVAMFIDPSAGRGHLRSSCGAAAPDALLGPWKAQLLRVMHGCLRRIPSVVYSYRPGNEAPPANREPVAREPGDPALLTFTSGSTAAPKAAVRSHGLLEAQQSALAEAIELRPGEVDLVTLPIFALANLAAGVTSIIADTDLRYPGRIDATAVLRQIDAHRPTRSAASPAFFKRLAEVCERGNRKFGTLQQVYIGGAPVFPNLLERLEKLMPDGEPTTVYGSTEAEPISHAHWSDTTLADRDAMAQGRGLLVGKPVPQIDLCIADSDRLSVGAMDADAFTKTWCSAFNPGEILVTGDHVLKGYLNPTNDRETKLCVGGTVWHRTGDCGYLDNDGRLWLLGRLSARVTDGRGTLYPFAVECAAQQIEGVRRAALCEHEGQRVLSIEADGPGALDSLREHFGDRIDCVVRLERIPLDKRHNAKVDYPRLRQMLEHA